MQSMYTSKSPPYAFIQFPYGVLSASFLNMFRSQLCFAIVISYQSHSYFLDTVCPHAEAPSEYLMHTWQSLQERAQVSVLCPMSPHTGGLGFGNYGHVPICLGILIRYWFQSSELLHFCYFQSRTIPSVSCMWACNYRNDRVHLWYRSGTRLSPA